MAFSQSDYVNKYNKENYKLYQFRIKRSDVELIRFLDSKKDRNKFILTLLMEESKKRILEIDEIKELSIPIFKKYKVKEVYLFGSYARGNATQESDIDFYISGLSKKLPWGGGGIIIDLKEALCKEIDIVEKESKPDSEFLEEIKKDFVKIL